MNNEELTKKLDTIEKLAKNNSNDIKNNLSRIQQNSGALEILRDYKMDSKRWFTILIIVLFMWFATIGYLVYVLNDIGTIEETTQEVQDVNTINGNVVNGDMNGQD